jgi:fatty acid desaturase
LPQFEIESHHLKEPINLDVGPCHGAGESINLVRKRLEWPGPSNRHSELQRLISERRLLERQAGYYLTQILANWGLVAVGVLMLASSRSFYFQIFIGSYMAFVSTQMAFIVHDAGHQQIAKKNSLNNLIGLVHATLVLGFSYDWWLSTHNRHHRRPNQSGCDPDIDFMLLAFSESQALEKRGLARFCVRYQAYLFFPSLLLEAFSLRFESIRFLFCHKQRQHRKEALCLAVHYTVYFFVLFHFLPPQPAITVALLHNAMFGVYLGLIFVTNHKGMPLLSEETRVDFLSHQVQTSRNLKAHWLTDYCFGGLSCQIEHHLFPKMPRNRLREAQRIVRPYCELHDVDYCEMSLLQCYREVWRYLDGVGTLLQ